jgi:hypothetical protein
LSAGACVGGSEFHDGIDIQDEADRAIAKDGGSRKQVLVLEGVSKALDHHFLFADQFIDKDRSHRITRFDDDDNAFCKYFMAASSVHGIGRGVFVGERFLSGDILEEAPAIRISRNLLRSSSLKYFAVCVMMRG